LISYFKTKYCISLNSGTDALTLALHLSGVGRGDEVITPPNSFIASTASIVHLGAKPIFADVLNDQNIDPDEIKKKITKKTKAIMPVHLTGKPCKMDQIMKIARRFNIPVIEDAAQAIGTRFKNKLVGTFGEFGCFSAHPLKNLNAAGDGGYLITNNKKLAKIANLLRNHGIHNRNSIKYFGHVSRLDNLQAAILNIRLKSLNKVIKKRRYNAKIYIENLKNIKQIKLPEETKDEYSTYHTFVIQAQERDLLKKYLQRNGIETAIHYPYLINKQPAYKKIFKKNKIKFPNAEKQVKSILTLPVNQFLTKKDIVFISKKIKSFYG